MAELADLSAMEMLAVWDQLVMMPGEGAPARAQQLGTLARLSHERATSQEVGEWLGELEGQRLDELDADIARLARRDWERARRVPTELAVELAQASAQGQESWRAAREADDFAAFAPALARNVELARAYGECLAERDERPYDALLAEHDFGLAT
ncbi:MAG: carboxypeptidase Taq, partial [Solirubrobacteraceae bacterium]|nr:carboxypeptidase Taq [Solirubrobacteraceae bacterium]